MKLISRSRMWAFVWTLLVLGVAMFGLSVVAVSSPSDAFVRLFPRNVLVLIGAFSVVSTLLVLVQGLTDRGPG